MKKQMSAAIIRRALGALLTLALVMGLMPSPVAQEPYAGYTYVYRFTGNAYGTSATTFSDEALPASDIENYMRVDGASMRYSDTGGFWEIAGSSNNASLLAASNFESAVDGYRLNSVPAGSWVAFRINVARAGQYAATLTHGARVGGNEDTEAYFAKESAVEAAGGVVAYMSGTTPLWTPDFSIPNNTNKSFHASGTVMMKATEKAELTLDEDEYLLIIKANTSGSLFTYQLTLDGDDGDGFASEKHKYAMAQNATAYAAATATDASEFAFVGVTGLDRACELAVGESTWLTATPYLSNGTVATGTATVTYESSAPSVVSVTPPASGKFDAMMTANGVGTADITVSIEIAGVTKTYTRSVTVSELSGAAGVRMVYKFTNANREQSVHASGTINSATALGDTTNVPNITSATYDVTDGFWKYDTHYGSFNTETRSSFGWRMAMTSTAHWIVLKIQVPKSGYYAVSMENGSSTYGTEGKVYLTPSATLAASGASHNVPDTDIIGYIDCKGDGSETATGYGFRGVNLGHRYLEEGEYCLVLQPTRRTNAYPTKNHARLYPYALVLDGGPIAPVFLQGSIGTTELGVGNTELDSSTTVQLTDGFLSDGNRIDFEDASTVVTYGSSNNAVASVSTNGTVTAKRGGSADISATVSAGGGTESKMFTVNVTDADASGVHAVYRFVSNLTAQGADYLLYNESRIPASANTTTENIADGVISYEKTNGFWELYSGGGYNSGDGNADVQRYGMRFKNMTDGWVAVKIKVPKAGKYDATFRYGMGQYGGVYDAYFVSASELGASVDDYLSGAPTPLTQIDFYCTDDDARAYWETLGAGANYTTVRLNTFELPQVAAEAAGDEYYLILKKASGSSQLYPYEITLDGGDGTVFFSAGGAFDEDALTIGDTTSMTVNAYNSDGTIAAESEISGSFTSSNSSVASVGASTGVVSAADVGTAIISVPVTVGDVTKTAARTISVNHAATSTTGSVRVTSTGNVSLVDENETGFVLGESSPFQVGTEFRITAPEYENMNFVCWLNVPSNRVIGTDSTINFRVGSSAYITAVYRKTSDTDGMHVQFIDRNNKVLQSGYINSTNPSIQVPDDPFSVGYQFSHWSKNALVGEDAGLGENVTAADITGNTNYFANYTAEDASYTVTVNGEPEYHSYNEEVTLTANAESDGQAFSYWTRDGQIVGYDLSYTFYVWGDTSVAAVYSGAQAYKAPRISMDSVVKTATGKVIFMSERVMGDADNRLVESGILLNVGSGIESTMKLDGSYDGRALAQVLNNHGQFSVYCGSQESGTACFARAYMIYLDKEGICRVAYSNIVSGIAG